jgi:hypothetical protein
MANSFLVRLGAHRLFHKKKDVLALLKISNSECRTPNVEMGAALGIGGDPTLISAGHLARSPTSTFGVLLFDILLFNRTLCLYL